MNNWRFYWKLIGLSWKAQLQYRTSFLFFVLAYCVQTSAEFLGLWVLFDRFQSIEGWQFTEIGLLYGITSVSFGFAEFSSRGFDQFSQMVKSGDFDLIMLRPRNTALQIAGQALELMRLGRVVQGAVVLSWAIASLPVVWNVSSLLLLTFAMLGGSCLFYGLFVFQATLSFWTTETLEVMNIMTFGGAEAGRYPMSIYGPWFRRFFTFVIPLACITYYPLLAILDRSGASWVVAWLSPIAGVLFLVTSLLFWNVGVRHYRSTGS